jgi:hypothetical protein
MHKKKINRVFFLSLFISIVRFIMEQKGKKRAHPPVSSYPGRDGKKKIEKNFLKDTLLSINRDFLEIYQYIVSAKKPKFDDFIAANKENIVNWSVARHSGLNKDQLHQLWKQRFALVSKDTNRVLQADS